jgi:hypothetical protein
MTMKKIKPCVSTRRQFPKENWLSSWRWWECRIVMWGLSVWNLVKRYWLTGKSCARYVARQWDQTGLRTIKQIWLWKMKLCINKMKLYWQVSKVNKLGWFKCTSSNWSMLLLVLLQWGETMSRWNFDC